MTMMTQCKGSLARWALILLLAACPLLVWSQTSVLNIGLLNSDADATRLCTAWLGEFLAQVHNNNPPLQYPFLINTTHILASRAEAFFKVMEIGTHNYLDVLISTAASSDVASLIGSLSIRYNLPVILATGTSVSLSDKFAFPHYWRTTLSDAVQMPSKFDFMLHFQWAHAALIVEPGFNMQYFIDEAKDRGIELLILLIDPADPSQIAAKLQELKESHFRIVMHIFGAAGTDILRMAIDMDLLGAKSKHTWIIDNLRIDSEDIAFSLRGAVTFSYPFTEFIETYNTPELAPYITTARDRILEEMVIANDSEFRRMIPNPPKQAELRTDKFDMFTTAHYPSVPYYAPFLMTLEVQRQFYASAHRLASPDEFQRLLSGFQGNLFGINIQFDKNQDNVKTDTSFTQITHDIAKPIVFGAGNTADGFRMLISQKKMIWPDGTHRVPDDGIANELYIHYSSAGGIIAIFIYTVFTAILVTTVAYIIYARERSPVIKLATPESLVLILVGMQCILTFALAWVGRPSPGLCELRIWFFFGGGSLVYASLCAKSARVTYLFANATSLRKVSVKTWKVMLLTVLLVLPQLILLIINSAVAPSYDIRVLSTDHSRVDVRCYHDHTKWLNMSYAYSGLLLIAALVFAYLNRKVPYGFNETRHIFISEYLVTAFVVVGSLVSNAALKSAPLTAITFSVVPAILGVFVLYAAFFGPKLYISLLRPDLNTRDLIKKRESKEDRFWTYHPPDPSVIQESERSPEDATLESVVSPLNGANNSSEDS